MWVCREHAWLSVVVGLALGTTPGAASQFTYSFNGEVTSILNSSAGRPEFDAFSVGQWVGGSLVCVLGAMDEDPDGSHGFFNVSSLSLDVTVTGAGSWHSSGLGQVETWNNQPDVYPFDDVASYLADGSSSFSGTSLGNNVFVGIQLVFGDASPPGQPDMLGSDGMPTDIAGWEQAFLYLNFFDNTTDPWPTTVRLQLVPTPAPEPTTPALLALALAVLTACRRRR
jgi:hypothetical protein